MEEKESKVIFIHILEKPIAGCDFNLTDYIDYEHKQDCCEEVYIDFDHVDAQKDELTRMGIVKKMEIVTAPEEGIIVNLYNGENDGFSDTRVSIFLACRNYQNGYYNSALELIVNIEGVVFKKELQNIDCVYNIID